FVAGLQLKFLDDLARDDDPEGRAPPPDPGPDTGHDYYMLDYTYNTSGRVFGSPYARPAAGENGASALPRRRAKGQYGPVPFVTTRGGTDAEFGGQAARRLVGGEGEAPRRERRQAPDLLQPGRPARGRRSSEEGREVRRGSVPQARPRVRLRTDVLRGRRDRGSVRGPQGGHDRPHRGDPQSHGDRPAQGRVPRRRAGHAERGR